VEEMEEEGAKLFIITNNKPEPINKNKNDIV
jgi:hypothetical protein